MRFLATELAGVFVLEPELREDERGFFARTWCAQEFATQGLATTLAQVSISYNHKRGTLRGMHYQAPPNQESKVVRCTAGAIYDVALDLREDSKTYKRWFATELNARNRNALYVPEGCAHGFLTLEDHCEVLYQISAFQHPDSARGVRWNDPAFGIQWPFEPVVLSARDRNYATIV